MTGDVDIADALRRRFDRLANTAPEPRQFIPHARLAWASSVHVGTLGLIGTALLAVVLVLRPAALQPGGSPSLTPMPAVTMSALDVGAARSFRLRVGLRADDAWIRAVAGRADAAAGLAAYGFPLTPAERSELDARPERGQPLEDAIDLYGRSHSDEWGGLYLDGATHQVFALFTGHLEEHARAISGLVNPRALVEVRAVTRTVDALTRLQETVTADMRWFATVDAQWRGTSVDIRNNRVLVAISSTNPNAPALIRRHFAREGAIDVQSDGLGPWNGGSGTVVITALDESGAAVPGLDCLIVPDVPSAFESGDTAWSTTSTGECRIPDVGATGYRVDLVDRARGATIVGTGRIVVVAGETAQLTITVRP